ncbi:restriction endonuclease subunit S [Klebsiella quasipneumoniae]|nr:restriction endonuclease subunit S [Klebsiella quasipneumoniae]EJR0360868.1 restriction endonuclease subunit S [Klebsiella quasipneumoniae]EKV4332855.1 restriction endonuclease subunit S [Klebsiella quasipneumoniae]EKV4334763.1 restriction endonuclease subunit S [Klebsiella quasipneumoniae]
MGSNWKTVRLGDYCIKIGSGATPKGGNSVYTDTGNTYFIRSQNVYNDGFNTNGLVFITDEAAFKLKNVDVQENDVLLNITGDSVARVCIAPRAFLPARVNQHVAIIRPKNDAFDPRFLRYFLSSPHQQTLLLTLASAGATRNALTKGMIEDLQVPKPPVYAQKSIANVLDCFDKKIESNNKINQTLEQMSQTLFKSWFVDFDPVIDNALDAGNPIPEALHSRAELRQKVRNSADFKPLPADIRALFTAEFEETELGWVPRGWKAGSIPDIAFINSTSWGTKNQPDYVNYVDLSNAKDGIISSIEEIPFEDAPSRARRILKKDDLIFGLVRPANRSFAYVHVDGLTGSTGFAVIRAKNKIYKNFIYYFVTYDKNIEELARIADGGAYPAIKPDDICSLPLIIPPEEIVQRFDESTSNFRDLMNNSLVQNDHLTTLRDTLLPKLISGELSLEDLPDLVTQTEPA